MVDLRVRCAETKTSLRVRFFVMNHTQGLSSHKYGKNSLKGRRPVCYPQAEPAQHIAMCLDCPREMTSHQVRKRKPESDLSLSKFDSHVYVACRNQVEQE